MPTHRLLYECVIAAVLASSTASPQDRPAKKLVFVGPSPPAELHVLAPLVGQWESKWQVRPSLQDKEGYALTGQATGEWLHNRHFIRVEGTATNAKNRIDTTVLYTYDAKKKVYRRWLFASTGLATESEGHWDANKRTMTWKAARMDPGFTGGITDVITQDRIETTVLFKRDDGKALADITVIATRKK